MSELPDDLVLEADYGPPGGRRVYVYTEPELPRLYAGSAEFVVRNDGQIEINTTGAPCVPVEVFTFLTIEADRLRVGGGA